MSVRKRVRLVVIGCAGTAILGIVLFVAPIAATSGDQQAIREVIQKRMDVIQGFGATADGMLAADLNSSQSAAHDLLASVYEGALLAVREKEMDASLDAQSSGQLRVYGGGTSSLDYVSIQIDGAKATASVHATTWSLIGEDVDGKIVTARPTNSETFTFSLVDGVDGWRIDGESFEFDPGSEP